MEKEEWFDRIVGRRRYSEGDVIRSEAKVLSGVGCCGTCGE